MLKRASLPIAVFSLCICLVSSVLVFLGNTTMQDYKQDFLFWSILYIVFATVWTRRGRTIQSTSVDPEEEG
jgi:hypothetical protein